MLETEIERLKGAYSKVLMPKKRKWKPYENPTIVAFDIEDEATEILRKDEQKFELRKPLGVTFAFMKENEVKVKCWDVERAFAVEELLEKVLSFLREEGIEPSNPIFLFSHFSIAEVRHLSNWKRAKVVSYGDSSLYLRFKNLSALDKTYDLRIIDTFPYFLKGLDKVAKWVGMDKISLEGFQGRTDREWKANMRELKERFPEKFWEYAMEDSRILIVAVHKWRDFFLKNFGYDILKARAYTSAFLSGELFSLNYLKEPVEPTRKVLIGSSRQIKPKVFQPQIRVETRYAGNVDKRYFALRAYKGGRREAFERGLIKEPIEVYDFSNFYCSCALVQPLPNKDTEWFYLEGDDKLEEILKFEGFAEASFKFPEGTRYPSLAVYSELHKKLIFPLEGRDFFTIFELRKAHEQRAKISDIRAWCFKPSKKEINHSLKAYLEFWRNRKRDLEEKLGKEQAEKTVDYTIAKLFPNALIGKLVMRVDEWSYTDAISLYEELQSDERKFQSLAKYRKLIHKKVGSTWAPEYGSLILGRARAILGEAFRIIEPISGHTDSLITRALTSEKKAQLQALAEKENVTISLKGSYDSLWIMRSACNVYFRNGKAVDCAHHPYSVNDKQEFHEIIEANLKAGKPILDQTRKNTMIKLKTCVKKGIPLGSTYEKTMQINWSWDYKRKLQNPNVDIWRDHSKTVPYRDETEAYEDQLKIISKPLELAKRQKKQRREQIRRRAREMYAQGYSIREIAERLGVSKSTVARMVKDQIRGIQSSAFLWKHIIEILD